MNTIETNSAFKSIIDRLYETDSSFGSLKLSVSALFSDKVIQNEIHQIFLSSNNRSEFASRMTEKIDEWFPVSETLEEVIQRHLVFTRRTFVKSTWESSLIGLRREINEVLEETDPDKKLIEYVDCFQYLVDSLSRAGYTIDDMKKGFAKKIDINEEREWILNDDNSYSHVK